MLQLVNPIRLHELLRPRRSKGTDCIQFSRITIRLKLRFVHLIKGNRLFRGFMRTVAI